MKKYLSTLLTIVFILVGVSFARNAKAVLVQVFDTGAQNPTVAELDSGAGTSWTNPNNIKISDDNYVYVSLSNGHFSKYLKVTNFGFNLPDGVIIGGIKVEVEKHEATGANKIIDHSIKIIKNGIIGGDEKADTLNYWSHPNDQVVAYGEAGDLWGLTWTADDINSAGFGVAVSALNSGPGESSRTAHVDNIKITIYYTLPTDNTPPVITINSYNTTPTNQDVVVTATTNEGTLNTTSHTFTENGSFDFIATDAAGNSTTQTVTISNIDKIAPVITVTNPDGNPAQSKTITALMNKEGTLSMSVNGSSTCDATLTFTDYSSTTFSSEEDNGKFVCYRAIDQAGNTAYQSSQAISGIDTVALITGISYSTTEWTNKDVIATLNQSEPITITNNDGLNTYTFSDNGSFVFEFTDAAGNTGTATASVSNIDKTIPVISLGIYSTTPTNQDITVTASTNEGVLNTDSHTFTENGSFDFVATDAAGNSTTQTVTISNIDKIASVITLNGTDPVSLTVGDSYIEAGATANDAVDGTITVTPSGIVDTNVAGTYTITYTATDTAGNVSTKTRTINVAAQNQPEVVTPAPITRHSSGGYLRPVNTGRTTSGQVLGAEIFVFTLPLKLGSRGAEVTELQKRLIADGYLKITTPTGYFGTLTQKAVKAFQKAHGLVADGVVGPETRLALNG